MTMTTENRTSHPARNAFVAAVIVILAALVVFPGFVAAGLSRGKRPMVMFVVVVPVDVLALKKGTPPKGGFECDGPLASVLSAMFEPAEKLTQVSSALLRFYNWQYILAGGAQPHPRIFDVFVTG
jgi:hypothetical protein